MLDYILNLVIRKTAHTVPLRGRKEMISITDDLPLTRTSCLTNKESRTTEAELFSKPSPA